MAMIETSSDCAKSGIDELGHSVDVVDAAALIRDGTACLVDKDSSGKSSPADQSALLSANRDIVIDLGARSKRGNILWAFLLTMVIRTGWLGSPTKALSFAKPKSRTSPVYRFTTKSVLIGLVNCRSTQSGWGLTPSCS